jgi:hypothetical protein
MSGAASCKPDPAQAAANFLGYPPRTNYENVWLKVDGHEKCTFAFKLPADKITLAGSREHPVLMLEFPHSEQFGPEFPLIARGIDYQIVSAFFERSVLYAVATDPREVQLIHPVGMDFVLEEEILYGEETIGERKNAIGFVPRKNKSVFLRRVQEITDSNQYRIITNQFGDNKIQCSPNLRGKEIVFSYCGILLKRKILPVEREAPALPLTVYILAPGAGGAPMLCQVEGFIRRETHTPAGRRNNPNCLVPDPSCNNSIPARASTLFALAKRCVLQLYGAKVRQSTPI